MRILYLSQYYPPEMGAPAARVSELSRRWVERGHEVCVLTGFPNHPTGIVPPEYRGRFLQTERRDGVEVVRSYVYATPNKGFAKRVAAFLSFALSSLLLGAWTRPARRVDVVVATSPQFFCAVSGYLLSRLKRVPFVLEIRDLWPESIVELGVLRRDAVVTRILVALELFLYRQADLLVSVTDSYPRTWVEQGIDPAKMRVVKNGVDLDFFRPGRRDDPLREELGLGDAFVVSYIGTHGMAQGLTTLVEAADRLREEPDLLFLLVGEGAEKEAVIALAREKGLENIRFLPQQPRDRIPALLALSDLVAVPLRRKALFTRVIPSKIFEIMAAARPILLGVEGEAAVIVEAAGAGYPVPPEDPEALAEVVRRVRSDPDEARRRGAAGRAYVEREFDRNRLADRFLADLEELVAGPPERGQTHRGPEEGQA